MLCIRCKTRPASGRKEREPYDGPFAYRYCDRCRLVNQLERRKLGPEYDRVFVNRDA